MFSILKLQSSISYGRVFAHYFTVYRGRFYAHACIAISRHACLNKMVYFIELGKLNSILFRIYMNNNLTVRIKSVDCYKIVVASKKLK